MEQYQKALKSGERSYHNHVSKGLYPYPPALEEILPDYLRYNTESLGVIQIPAEQMVGTTTSGRKTAFAPNFMPLLPSHTEFAAKWTELCRSHEKDGIWEPVTAYEYMNHYYVTEGNKRVSVLKFFQAPTIPASVTRILPPKDDSLENRLYYEYLDFSRLTGIHDLMLSRLGDYSLLLHRLGVDPGIAWTEEERRDFRSFTLRFTQAYHQAGGDKLPITAGDAMLVYLKIYQPYSEHKEKIIANLQKDLSRIWDNILLRCQNNSAALLMEPSSEPKRSFLERILPSSSPMVKVAFLHSGTSESSHWTYCHELGRTYLEQTFGDQLTTSMYDGLTAETADSAIRAAIDDGNTILFTTAAGLIEPSLMAAIDHPEIKILNCSLNCSHRYIRTYYGRMYEAMFLTGAIAGVVSPTGRIGYAVDFPTYGRIADINAFAIGAKMVNPRAVIDLQWFPTESWDPDTFYTNNDTVFLLGPENHDPGKAPGPYGLYRVADDRSLIDIAMPIWHWGRFYERLIRSTLSGSWKQDDADSTYKALNYWWGLSSDIVDVITSRKFYTDTDKLIRLLRQSIIQGTFYPFTGPLYSQNGTLQVKADQKLSPVEIITMDWLCENISGSIPRPEDFPSHLQQIVQLQGIGSYEQQWQQQMHSSH